MNLQQRLFEDLKSAMKVGDRLRAGTLRLVRAQLQNAQIDKGRALSEQEELDVLIKAAKKHKEAMEAYQRGDRQELFEKEEKELKIVSEYLPTPLTREEVAQRVTQIIDHVGAVGLKDMGKVMAVAMTELKGRADGKMVQEIVREELV